MEHLKEEVREAVSPLEKCMNSNNLSLCILVVLEFEVPIHDLPIVSLVTHAFLPIPRFTSIMDVDSKGVKRWKQVEVKFEEHIIEPRFCDGNIDSYDKHFGDYLSRLAMEKLPQNKPLWQAHVIKYPTSNASGTLVFKFHHAIGDGYTLMGLLLSSLQRYDDPSIPLSFPFRKPSKPQNTNKLFFMIKRFPKLISMAFNSMSDFGWSMMKSTLIEDDRTPIRSGVKGVEFRPTVISHVTFPIDHIKEIKTKLGVTINDVITGIIFYGIRLYMKDIENRSRKLSSTSLVMVNTRKVGNYQTVQDMLKTNAKGAWGNHVAYLHLSMPKLLEKETPISNPLQFVNKAHTSIKSMRNSFATLLIEKFLLMEQKLKGTEAVAKSIHRTLRNSSLLMSNMVGPIEQMALANHPIKDYFFTVCGLPQSLVITIMSYKGMLRVTSATEEGFIDEQKLVWNLNNAFQAIRREAAAKDNIPTKNKF